MITLQRACPNSSSSPTSTYASIINTNPWQCSNCPKGGGGRNFSLGRWVERRGGGRNFCSTRVEKEMGGRILSSIIEERGKLHNKSSLWCKSLIRNRFKGAHTVCHSNTPPEYYNALSCIWKKPR